MAWTIEYLDSVRKTLDKMDRGVAREIYGYLDDLRGLDDVRVRGKGLTANRSGLWHYRVRDIRIICEIQDEVLKVLVVHIGKRETAYR